ncbi:hypothetical protein [Shewanella sp.]|uniref:hypothetical protein n=1 Tax=Shewanella sp. TaxID=50422 RepID=UPI004054192F
MQSVAATEAITWSSLAIMSASFTVLIGFIKLMLDLHFEKKKFHHKNIEIAQSSLSANLHKPSLKQRFLTEQVFSLMYRCKLSYDEINVLLRYPNPSRAFELFIKGKMHLKISNNMKSIGFDGNYWSLSIWKLNVYPRDLLHFSKYIFLGMVGSYALAPAIYVVDQGSWFTVPKLGEFFGLIGWVWVFLSSLVSFVFWVYAFKSVAAIGNVGAAFAFVKMVRKSVK